jgi:hypothetical protein
MKCKENITKYQRLELTKDIQCEVLDTGKEKNW